METFTATWLGDADPLQQVITEGGLTFIKGEPVKVPVDLEFNGLPWARKIRGNPMFSVEKNAEPIKSDDAEQPEETGTERAELKRRLDELGVTYAKNSTDDALRGKLATALAGQS